MIENLKSVTLKYDDIQKCFLVNEKPCDYNSLFGLEGEMQGNIEEGVILYGDIYTSDFSILNIIKILGESYDKMDAYDEIASMGRGSSKYYAIEDIIGTKGAIVIRNFEFLKDIKIKPISEFIKEYPNYNEHNYNLVMDAFDKYYSN
jgi:hypothetical protein